MPLIQLYTSSGPSSLNSAYSQFIEYKTRVPVCGAILLSEDWTKCLLVKGWGKGASWTFPKGKINQDEPKRDCAVRELREETGFDASEWLPENSNDYFELTQREQRIRLYVVPGVPSDTPFATQTRREISRIEWFKLSELPTAKKPKTPSPERGGKFYMVMPFVMRLRRWIQANKRTHPRRPATPAPKDEGRINVDELFASATPAAPRANSTPGLINLPPSALRQMAAHAKATMSEPRSTHTPTSTSTPTPKEPATPLQPLPAPPSTDAQPRMDGSTALRALLGLSDVPIPTMLKPADASPPSDQSRHTLLSILNASGAPAPSPAPGMSSPQPAAVQSPLMEPSAPRPVGPTLSSPLPAMLGSPPVPAADANRAQLMASLLSPPPRPVTQAVHWSPSGESSPHPPAPQSSLLSTLLGPMAARPPHMAPPVPPPAVPVMSHAVPPAPPANTGAQNLLSILNGPTAQPLSAKPDASKALLATLLQGQEK